MTVDKWFDNWYCNSDKQIWLAWTMVLTKLWIVVYAGLV